MNDRRNEAARLLFPASTPAGRVPGLPQTLDALLLLLCALTSPRMFHQRLRLVDELRRWPRVYKTSHAYGGIQFNVGERELGHLHGNGVLDLLFSRRLHDELVGAGQAFAHHTFPDSGWVSLAIRSRADIERAVELLRTAYCWRTGATFPPE